MHLSIAFALDCDVEPIVLIIALVVVLHLLRDGREQSFLQELPLA